MTVQAAIVGGDDAPYNCDFTEQELEAAIWELHNTAPGQDYISNMFLKNCPYDYKIFLLALFNKSWVEETVPQKWKVGLVIPVHKPYKPVNEITSYRPITMVSCIAKLMERLVGKMLQWEIERNRYLSATQCGFRSNRLSGEQVLGLENYIASTGVTRLPQLGWLSASLFYEKENEIQKNKNMC